ncbi:hypothetical protein GCM10027417_06870 [Glutamicibacter endophyticus]
MAEELLALGEGGFEHMAIDPGGVEGKAPLRGADGHRLPAEDVIHLAGEAM